jgi:hypothetical protein
MTQPPTTIRRKEVCMLEADWRDFGRALAETYPQARYYLDPDYVNDPETLRQTRQSPTIRIQRHLSDIPRRSFHADEWRMVFDPDWQPEFERFHHIGEPEESWHWLLWPPPHPYVLFRPGGYLRDRPVPHPDTGYIHFYATPKNKEHLALAARFFRLFGKFATNSKGLARVRLPGYEVTAATFKGASYWCGYHAMEWTRGDPKRVMFYTSQGFGTRATGAVVNFARGRKT